mgnify:CR=1 FL=1
MTEKEFRNILCEAMNEEYNWVSQPEELVYNYSFSPKFEERMQTLISRNTVLAKKENVKNTNDKPSAAASYIWIGHHAFRKAVVIIVAAAMMFALVACATIYAHITWRETQNDDQGTLDATFDIERNQNTLQGFEAKQPELPQDFEIVEEEKNVSAKQLDVLYQNKGKVIYYSQESISENMSLSIDNDDEGFTEITVNGNKGYAIKEDASPYMIWSDGEYLYHLSGTVSYELLEKMAKSVR